MEIESFEKSAAMFKDQIHAYAFLMLKDGDAARDVAQETLVRLWQNWDQVDPAAMRAWLMRTTHNLCIDIIRKRKVRSEVDGEKLLSSWPDRNPDPARLTASSELSKRIQDSLESLLPQDRAVVVMREVQGMAYNEIARVLGLPLGTLKARLHRAREKLRSKLIHAGVTP